MKKQILIVISSMIALFATAQPNKKVAPALNKFLNTEFMIKYRDLRIEAESAAIGIQSKQDGLKSAEIFRLRSAYDQTASRANQLIESIKQDFLNSKKLKSISEFPEMYSDGLRYKLQELADFYAANFQQALADISSNQTEVDGSATLLLIVELIGLTKGLTNYFSDIKREARQYTDKYLQENLVQPNRWRYWDELSGNASPYENFQKSTEPDLTQPQEQDKFDAQLQRLNQTISTLPQKNTEDTFNLPPDDSMTSPDATLKFEDWSPDATTTATDSIPPPPPGKQLNKPGVQKPAESKTHKATQKNKQDNQQK